MLPQSQIHRTRSDKQICRASWMVMSAVGGCLGGARLDEQASNLD